MMVSWGHTTSERGKRNRETEKGGGGGGCFIIEAPTIASSDLYSETLELLILHTIQVYILRLDFYLRCLIEYFLFSIMARVFYIEFSRFL